MTGSRKQITVIHLHPDGHLMKTKVQAEIYGVLAVHPRTDPLHEQWVITHVPSGYVVFSDERKSLVLKIVKELCLLDWSKIKGPNSKRALAKITPMRRAILDKFKISKNR